MLNPRKKDVLRNQKEITKELSFIEELRANLSKFLDFYGRHFLKNLDKNVRVTIPFKTKDNKITFREMSLLEYVSELYPKMKYFINT